MDCAFSDIVPAIGNATGMELSEAESMIMGSKVMKSKKKE